jgi:N-acetyl-anhydromuramyl-L-alanine amidase AmpD
MPEDVDGHEQIATNHSNNFNKMYNFCESPNKWKDRNKQQPEAIIIHICDGTFEGSKAWFLNPRAYVSAHFLISETGEILQMVKCEDTAWHAGVVIRPVWKLLKQGLNPNSYTIGIELAGYANKKPAAIEIMIAARLVAELCKSYKIALTDQNIIPHFWINGAKTCPGPNVNVPTIIYLAGLYLDKM